MPVIRPGSRRRMAPATDREGGGRVGKTPRQFGMLPGVGVPRFEDLLSLRVLERSPTISLPMNTVRDQITTTNWGIRPTADNPGPAHEEATEEVEDFFDGGFNPNSQQFSNLLQLLVTDVISADTGVLEMVPTTPDASGTRWLGELWHLDGITMSKDLTPHGETPEPPEPAYYQFAPRNSLATRRWSDVIDQIGGTKHGSAVISAYGRRDHDPIAFSRDQVAWMERNPQTATNYGFGVVQQVKHWAEVLLNVDVSNNRYFSDHQIPQGVLTIASGSRQTLEENRDYFRDTLRGETDHQAPIFDAHPDEVSWTPIQGSPEELQFLDSQQWYHKLVWFCFGLNQGEIGDSADVNRSTADAHSRQVFRQTTKPILDDVAALVNSQVLPRMEAYHRVDGEIEFYFEVEHEQMERLERQRQQEDLEANLTTPNAIRQERGKEEVPWGDLPPTLIEAVARQYPEWALEHWGDLDPDSVPDPGLGDMDLLAALPSEQLAGHGGGGAEGGCPDKLAPDGQQSTADTRDDRQQPLLAEGRDTDGGGSEGNLHYAERSVEELREDEGELGDEFPAVEELTDSLQGELQRLLEGELSRVEEAVERIWPESDSDDSLVVDIDTIVDELSVAEDLVEPVIEHNGEAMQASADQEAERLEEELDQEYGLVEEVAQIEFDFDLRGTFAFEEMRRRAAKNMTSVEGTIKQRIRTLLIESAENGDGVSKVTQTLTEEVPELTRSHSRLVARTELPMASRQGTQALAESTDVIGGKDWIPTTGDNRTRPWHLEMATADPIETDASWTVPSGWSGEPHYQPRDYPREAFVVGEDQPFNCRCLHQSVLEEDLPDDARGLREYDGVSIALQVTERQFDVWTKHAEPGETMAELLARIDKSHSRQTEAPETLGIALDTLYQWLREYDLM